MCDRRRADLEAWLWRLLGVSAITRSAPLRQFLEWERALARAHAAVAAATSSGSGSAGGAPGVGSGAGAGSTHGGGLRGSRAGAVDGSLAASRSSLDGGSSPSPRGGRGGMSGTAGGSSGSLEQGGAEVVWVGHIGGPWVGGWVGRRL
jgi:hypothetical protein